MQELVDQLVTKLPPELAAYWWALGSDGPRYLLYVQGVVGVVVWLWLAHRLYRWIKGERYALGHWRSKSQFDALIQYLYEEHRAGKVLPHAEMKLLRQYTEGTSATISDQRRYY